MYDFLFVIIELFLLALTVETLQAEICRRERFLKGWVLRSPILGGRGRRPPTTVGWQKTERIALSCGVKNIAGRFFGLVTKHACDRRTDGQNCDSQATSRGENVRKVAFGEACNRSLTLKFTQSPQRRHYIRYAILFYHCAIFLYFSLRL